MNLPNDVARCQGMTVYAICEKRETCRRYLEPVKASRYVSYMFPAIPGPCEFYIEAPSKEATDAG